MDPAIEGTNNVLKAAKELGVERVVVTSSVSAVVPSPSWPADVVKTEECWADEEYCRKNEVFILLEILLQLMIIQVEMRKYLMAQLL